MRAHASLFSFPSEIFSLLPCSSHPTRYYSKHTPSPSVEDLIAASMATGGRRHSRRMRGGGKIARPDGADLMKVGSGIHDLVRLASHSGKSGACGIRMHAGASATVGHIVKPGAAKSVMKPSSTDSAEEAWIYVHGCRIKRASLCFNLQGDVCVLDSENEEVAVNGAIGVELALAVAVDGATGLDLALAIAADRAAGVDLAPMVAATGTTSMDVAPKVAAARASVVDVAPDGVAGVNMNPEVAGHLAKKFLGENLHPEVTAHLGVVLSRMEPLYHEFFIDMYKLLS